MTTVDPIGQVMRKGVDLTPSMALSVLHFLGGISRCSTTTDAEGMYLM